MKWLVAFVLGITLMLGSTLAAMPQDLAQQLGIDDIGKPVLTARQVIADDFAALGAHGVAMADVPHLICGGGPCPYQFVLDDAGIVNSPVALMLVPKEWAAMARQ
jgi:hypothetical protein